ncbi:zinc-binding alcohol dehydrogenase family protein [Roseibium salinum]|uniref:Zinc-binding alcohol dehydrogenase family protein n=1 Tax=Roseibium salinum TaxID=1604349 RepID=A0ABT3QW59_9HYPH|nr:zinc-binding alcohol dehydrogenase family protein [Roseibium sp. DSM 29163]MCX2721168.1 zinc-binding alcohol dehydrogenase family protein [Roseibium sp. DSM 29163]
MDALVCTQPGTLELQHIPPPVPADGQVLVRPRRIGICGTDYHIFEGKHPFLNYPRVMGHELAVEVVDAPAGSGFKAGEICAVNPYLSCGSCISCRNDRPNCCTRLSVLGVHQDGGMTELLCLPPDNLIRGDGLSVDACASVEFLAIGAHAVRRAGVAKGERVLVVGTGPIGVGTTMFARIAGGDVSVLDLDVERMRTIASITGGKAIEVPNGTSPADAALAATDGEGFDVVFDATGNKHSMEASFSYVAHGGRLIFVGVLDAEICFSDPDFHRREMTLLASRNATGEDFTHVMAQIRGGAIPVGSLISHRTSLEASVADLPLWARDKAGLIKAVISID